MKLLFGPILALAVALVAVVLALPAHAQCRVGSGPDMGDGIPYCSELSQPSPEQPRQPAQWQNSAAAVVWGYKANHAVFVGVEHYVDEDLAADAAIAKCKKNRWQDCTLAVSITNGVIVVGVDERGELALLEGEELAATKSKFLANCAAHNLKCKILKVFDGRPQRY